MNLKNHKVRVKDSAVDTDLRVEVMNGETVKEGSKVSYGPNRKGKILSVSEPKSYVRWEDGTESEVANKALKKIKDSLSKEKVEAVKKALSEKYPEGEVEYLESIPYEDEDGNTYNYEGIVINDPEKDDDELKKLVKGILSDVDLFKDFDVIFIGSAPSEEEFPV